MDKIASLRPAFGKEGTVTAANASTINDGAAALVLMSREKAEEFGLEVLAYYKRFRRCGYRSYLVHYGSC